MSDETELDPRIAADADGDDALRRRTLRVGYEVWLEVGVDSETGLIVDVTVYTEEANGAAPVHVYDDYDGNYLAKDDPRYTWAVNQAEKIAIGMSPGYLERGRDNVPWTNEPSGF